MPSYDVRIHFNRAVAGDDGRLAAAMRAVGFAATVGSSKGVIYKLPPGQFVFTGERSLQEIVKLGREAADKIGKSYAICASEVVARTWRDLSPAARDGRAA